MYRGKILLILMIGGLNMGIIFRQTQLYKFLRYCNEQDLEKVVLDCGAGGNCPPLALFAENGYKTLGIEFDDAQLDKANQFAKDHGLELNILKGDMRELHIADKSISYVFSYNAIFHMKKNDISKSIGEMKRVLKPGGLCFVNFLTVNDFGYGEGEELGKGEYLQREGEDKVIHTYYEIHEGDAHFDDMEIIFKENRVLERIFEGEKIRQGYIDYIVRKKK